MLEDFDFNAPWMSHNNMWDPELNMSFGLKEGKKEKKLKNNERMNKQRIHGKYLRGLTSMGMFQAM